MNHKLDRKKKLVPNQVDPVSFKFSHALVLSNVHQVKTKKTTTVKEVWITALN